MNPMITLILTTLFFSGCEFHTSDCHYDDHGDYHCHDVHWDETTNHHPTTTIVTTTSPTPAQNLRDPNNIIIVEEVLVGCDYYTEPYPYEPEWCTLIEYDNSTGYESCCMWLGIGVEEVYCHNEYCGWELEQVYMY
tara:strand:+ start:1576 stop:1983 length:408 start_codon:yes stop_codon:yes gene_type:complete